MKNQLLTNYHTHSRWSRHGSGEIEEYIEEGLRHGLKELAITEPVPHENHFSWIPWEQFPIYDEALNRAKEKYADRLHVIKGFECEYYPQDLDHYRRFQDAYGYKLLLLGQHRCGKQQEYDIFQKKEAYVLHAYAEDVCRGLETGLFDVLAHPDCVLVKYENGWDKHCEQALSEIFQACEELHIPVEINANGLRGGREYPSREAFLLSKNYHLDYMIGSDAHHVKQLCDEDGWKRAAAFADELGLSVLPSLPLKHT